MAIGVIQNTNTHNKEKKSIIIFEKAKQKEVAPSLILTILCLL
jgi:hypothetical protein